MNTVKTHAVHCGALRYLKHDSAVTGTPMTLSVFTPPGEGYFPVVLWLSGLTCTEDNFTTKAGAYRRAAELGLIVVAPDTSRAARTFRAPQSPTTRPMTSVRAPASMSTPPRRPGPRTSGWRPMWWGS